MDLSGYSFETPREDGEFIHDIPQPRPWSNYFTYAASGPLCISGDVIGGWVDSNPQQNNYDCLFEGDDGWTPFLAGPGFQENGGQVTALSGNRQAGWYIAGDGDASIGYIFNG